MSHRVAISFERRHQAIHAGSHAAVPRAARRAPGPCTWSALIWLAAYPSGDDHATVLSELQGGIAARLALGPDGVLAVFGGTVLANVRWPALRRGHRVWQDGAFQGDVSRIMENVLRRFAAP